MKTLDVPNLIFSFVLATCVFFLAACGVAILVGLIRNRIKRRKR